MAVINMGDKGERVSNNSYAYDYAKSQWVKNADNNSLNQTTTEEPKTNTPPTNKITASGATEKSTKDGTDKKYREIEFCTLEGDIALLTTKDTIKIRVGDTINLKGVGSYLSGKYYVVNVRRTIDSDKGYSQSIVVIKTGFGDSLKQAEKTEDTQRAKKVSPKTENLKVGAKVKVYGDSAVYSNANDGKKVPNWVKNKTLTVTKLSDEGDRALLKEVFSWTYTQYLKQV